MNEEVLRDDLLSLTYARYTYRDTDIIEDSHAAMITMDMDFYEEVRISVNNKFTEFYNSLNDILKGKFKDAFTTEKILFALLAYSRNGDHWDPPELVEKDFTGDVAKFVLGGYFIEACREGLCLGDSEVISSINKDIYNRYYTLLHNGIIKNGR